MPQLSEITLIGHVGGEPLITTGKDNLLIAKFSVAYSRKRGEKESTTWFRCTAFGRTATAVQQFVHKGDPILVRGECHLETYQKDGVDKASLEVVAERVTFLKSREDGERPKDKAAVAAAESKSFAPGATANRGDDEPPFDRRADWE